MKPTTLRELILENGGFTKLSAQWEVSISALFRFCGGSTATPSQVILALFRQRLRADDKQVRDLWLEARRAYLKTKQRQLV